MEDMHCYAEMNSCYSNTFHAISTINFLKSYNRDEYTVAYGFIEKEVGDGLMFFRHAFIIRNEDSAVIDVTACLWEDVEDEHASYNYYIFKEYEFNKYNETIAKEMCKPALYEDNKEDEVKLVNELTKRGLYYNPIDLMELIIKVYGNDFMEGFRKYNESKMIVL